MAWYDPSWGYRSKITIDNTKVAGDETDFPVLITEDNLPAGFWTNVDTQGDDIVLTSDDEETKLKRELVNIDTGGETLELYVKVPSLASSADTDLYLYYGNAGATETDDTDTWNGDYLGVWHLQEDPSGGAPQAQDSTVSNWDLTSEGTMTSGDLVAMEPGKGWTFDAADDGASKTGLSIATLPTTFCQYGVVQGAAVYNQLGGVSIPASADALYSYIRSDGDVVIESITSGTSAGAKSTTPTYTDTDEFAVCGVWANATSRKVYTEGTNVVEDTTSRGTITATVAAISKIPYNSGALKGRASMSEFRVLDTDLSANWVSTEYNTIRDTANFYAVGAEEPQPSVGGSGRVIILQTNLMRR